MSIQQNKQSQSPEGSVPRPKASGKITPHLWFDKEAIEAAEFYTSVFSNSEITNKSKISNSPSGDCDIVSFNLRGQPFMAISAGPYF